MHAAAASPNINAYVIFISSRKMFIKYQAEVCLKGLLQQEWTDKSFRDIDCFILLQQFKQ